MHTLNVYTKVQEMIRNGSVFIYSGIYVLNYSQLQTHTQKDKENLADMFCYLMDFIKADV